MFWNRLSTGFPWALGFSPDHKKLGLKWTTLKNSYETTAISFVYFEKSTISWPKNLSWWLWTQFSQLCMVQMKSQCLSNREFPEFYKTPLTLNLSGIIRGVMGHLNKQWGLLSVAVLLTYYWPTDWVYLGAWHCCTRRSSLSSFCI